MTGGRDGAAVERQRLAAEAVPAEANRPRRGPCLDRRGARRDRAGAGAGRPRARRRSRPRRGGRRPARRRRRGRSHPPRRRRPDGHRPAPPDKRGRSSRSGRGRPPHGPARRPAPAPAVDAAAGPEMPSRAASGRSAGRSPGATPTQSSRKAGTAPLAWSSAGGPCGHQNVEPFSRLRPPDEEQAHRLRRVGIGGAARARCDLRREAEADHRLGLPAVEAVGAGDHRPVRGGVGDEPGAAPRLPPFEGVGRPPIEAVAQRGGALAGEGGGGRLRVTSGRPGGTRAARPARTSSSPR